MAANVAHKPAGELTLYGIKNCDTIKKARAWLAAHEVDYVFHDYKAAGIERERLEQWCGKVGWETLLNRSGTTFRKLPESTRASLNETKAITLMCSQPSMIKRPVLEYNRHLTVGFKAELYQHALRELA